MHRVFIGYDSRQDIAYRVLRYSILKHTTEPIEVRPIVLSELDFPRPADPLASTEFTYTRFLVPYLCGFAGRALFMDCDMLCLTDLSELLGQRLDDHWLKVVKHDHRPLDGVKMDGRAQRSYPRKNWSSLMLLDCSKLTAWSYENVLTKPAAWLHRFSPVPDEKLGELAPEWNVLDRYDERTKIIHYTEGGPWLPNYRNHEFGSIWFQYRGEALRCPKGPPVPAAITGSNHG
jgi:lipopolysaccharide biosynthesis glycosyltransferase